MTLSIYDGESKTSFVHNWIELRYEFLDLRACYWFFSSLVKKGSSALADVFIARIAFSKIYRRCPTGDFPFVVLDDYFKIDEENEEPPQLWEAALDFVSRFYKRLSLAKYSIINLGGFFIIEIGFQNNILFFCR